MWRANSDAWSVRASRSPTPRRRPRIRCERSSASAWPPATHPRRSLLTSSTSPATGSSWRPPHGASACSCGWSRTSLYSPGWCSWCSWSRAGIDSRGKPRRWRRAPSWTTRRGNGSVARSPSSTVSSAQLVAIALVTLPALAVVLWPVWRARGGHGPAPGIPAADRRLELLEEKAVVYRALKELSFDHEAGHLSDDDFRGLRDRYESRAAELLGALDALGPAETPTAPEPERPAAAPRAWTRHPAALVGGAALVLAFGIVIGLNAGRFSQPEAPMAAPGGMPPGMPAPDGSPVGPP